MIRTHGLTHLALAVRDADRASRFYQEVFGAVEVYRQKGFVQLQTPGARDVLVLEEDADRAGARAQPSAIDGRRTDRQRLPCTLTRWTAWNEGPDQT